MPTPNRAASSSLKFMESQNLMRWVKKYLDQWLKVLICQPTSWLSSRSQRSSSSCRKLVKSLPRCVLRRSIVWELIPFQVLKTVWRRRCISKVQGSQWKTSSDIMQTEFRVDFLKIKTVIFHKGIVTATHPKRFQTFLRMIQRKF